MAFTRHQLGLIGSPPWVEVHMTVPEEQGPTSEYVSLCSGSALVEQLLGKLCPALGLETGDVALQHDGRELDKGATLAASGLPSTGRVSLEFVVRADAAAALEGEPDAGKPSSSDLSLVKGLQRVWASHPASFLLVPGATGLLRQADGRGACASSWIKAGFCSACGARASNEDVEIVCCDWFSEPAPAALFAVCDGHGGPAVARAVGDRLGQELRAQLQGAPPEARRGACERAFLQVDGELRLEEHLDGNNSGCTCIAALVWSEGATHRVLFANLGDSRGLLCCESSGALLGTIDHKPDTPSEKQRVVRAGGFVTKASSYSPPRVDNDLAVSRAFGDFVLKNNSELPPVEQKVSPMPEIYELEAATGDTIVLACDGAFDVLTNEQVSAIALHAYTQRGDAQQAAVAVVHAALHSGSQDNVSCVFVRIGEGGTGPPTHIGPHHVDDQFGESW